MWNQLTPQQQQFLMQMLQRQGGGMPMQQNAAIPGAGMAQPQLGALQGQLGNPLMNGGNSAVTPQQQAAMMQYQQMLGSPQGWGAGANGNVPIWQLLMGRSPWYGQGTAVP